MKEIFKILTEELEQNRPAVLCRTIAASGSVPRGAGANMLVLSDGRTPGTVGGGAVEYQATLRAKELLDSGQSETGSYRLTQNEIGDIGMVCGGDVQIFFQFFDPARRQHMALTIEAARAADEPEDSLLVTRLGDPWQSGIWNKREGLRHLQAELPTPIPSVPCLLGDLYLEPLGSAETLYLVGAGHVGLALAPVVSNLGFRLVVMDSRERILTPEHLPTAQKLILGSYEEFSEKITVGEGDYVVVMTPGHEGDYAVLRQALRTPAAYIGCIGSRRKVAITRERLLAEGFTEADLARIHAPIGLPIGAETPEEIAISIAAELIVHRRKTSGKTIKSW